MAESELETARTLQADADELMRKFRAAGGVCEWKQ
jgi:hypothetical protein